MEISGQVDPVRSPVPDPSVEGGGGPDPVGNRDQNRDRGNDGGRGDAEVIEQSGEPPGTRTQGPRLKSTSTPEEYQLDQSSEESDDSQRFTTNYRMRSRYRPCAASRPPRLLRSRRTEVCIANRCTFESDNAITSASYCAIKRPTRSLRISESPTSDNLSPQETTAEAAVDVGADGGRLSCPGSKVVADSGDESA